MKSRLLILAVTATLAVVVVVGVDRTGSSSAIRAGGMSTTTSSVASKPLSSPVGVPVGETQTAAGASAISNDAGSGSFRPAGDSAPAVSPPDNPNACANPIVPEAVAMRESGCRWDAYNPTGCSGRGCVGFFQLDEGHFAAVSPWNPNVAGVCADLAGVMWAPTAQVECASRLGPGAWG